MRACVRPRPSWSGPGWWCRPTLKVAATPCWCASTTIRLCESATLSGCQRLEEHVAYLRHQRPPRTPPHTQRKREITCDTTVFQDFHMEVRKTALWKALFIDRCCCRCCCRHLVDISRHAASPYERLLEQIARHILPSQLWHDSVSSEATLFSVGAWPSHVSASVGLGSRLCFRLTTLVRAPVRRCRMLSSTLGRGGSTPAAANQP